MKIQKPNSKQPIPKHAKRVFRGIIFDTYQWKQKLYDGSYVTFEKIKRKSTVGVLPITKNGQIILTEQTQPPNYKFLGLLGGIVDDKDKNEDILLAAKRELAEEAGLKAEKWILWYAIQVFEKVEWSIYNFIAKDLTKIKVENPDKGEKIKLLYVSFNEFIQMTAQENFRDSEIALKIYQLKGSKKLTETKKLFLT